MKRLSSVFSYWKPLTVAVVLILATGCSTFSRKECESMNWSAKGHQSALSGETVDEGIAYFKNACGVEHRIEPDMKAYQAGYAEGLKEFCTPEASAQFARRGGRYQGTCPEAQHEKVVTSFNSGRVDYLEKKVKNLESKVSSLESDNDRLRSQNSDLERQINSKP